MRPPPPDDLTPWFLTLADLGQPFDWSDFFGNQHPIVLDVGSGRGLFLVNAAVDNPQTNHVGIEIDYREGRRAARRLKKRDMANARVLGGDAAVALEQIIAESSIAEVHVYFPDPWWKRRHRRRRLFTDEFVDLVARVLEPDGELHCWTDVEDYFEVIEVLIDHHPLFESLPPPCERAADHDMDYRTSFERKRRQAGCTIHRGRWRRISDDGRCEPGLS